jgi:hypothetical protein
LPTFESLASSLHLSDDSSSDSDSEKLAYPATTAETPQSLSELNPKEVHLRLRRAKLFTYLSETFRELAELEATAVGGSGTSTSQPTYWDLNEDPRSSPEL